MYLMKNKVGNKISYIYKGGFKTSVVVNYEKFLNDLMKYAEVDVDEIETEQDLVKLFQKSEDNGYSFGRTADSIKAVVRQWKIKGFTFRESEQEYRHRQIKILKDKKHRKKVRKELNRLAKKENINDNEYRRLMRWAFNE